MMSSVVVASPRMLTNKRKALMLSCAAAAMAGTDVRASSKATARTLIDTLSMTSIDSFDPRRRVERALAAGWVRCCVVNSCECARNAVRTLA